MKFIHKTTREIVDLPPHFAHAKIAKNFEPYVGDESEEDKVVVSHTANSQLRTAKFAKPTKFETPETEPVSTEDEN